MRCLTIAVVWSMLLINEVVGIRFVIDRDECLSHNVEYEGDNVHVSFVVIKSETMWHFAEDGVDLVVILFIKHSFLFLLHHRIYVLCSFILSFSNFIAYVLYSLPGL